MEMIERTVSERLDRIEKSVWDHKNHWRPTKIYNQDAFDFDFSNILFEVKQIRKQLKEKNNGKPKAKE